MNERAELNVYSIKFITDQPSDIDKSRNCQVPVLYLITVIAG